MEGTTSGLSSENARQALQALKFALSGMLLW